jgi:uncharacterized membrane protein YhaH (DUF805 family)
MNMENKSVLQCYLDGWKKCFVYKGTATRKAFGSFIFGNALLILVAGGLSYFWLSAFAGDGGMVLVWMYYVFLPLCALIPLVLFLPVLSLGIRRMHDTGKSGWWFGGAILINVVVMPILLTGIYSLVTNNFSGDAGRMLANGINIFLNIISIGFPAWLCCKPTKIKDPTPSSDAMN